MSDPTFLLAKRTHSDRKGAVLPLFALMLPVMLILCGFAINMAYMQLVTTEMKVATDVSSHAAGRALSEAQRGDLRRHADKGITVTPNQWASMSAQARRDMIVNETYLQVAQATNWNKVGGKSLNKVNYSNSGDIQSTIQALPDSGLDVHFGYSTRQNLGMYEFHDVPVGQIKAGLKRASSIGVESTLDIPLVFQTMNISKFEPQRRSIATQVDRDIALVLDRSGSMLEYKDKDGPYGIDQAIKDLYNDVVRKRRLRYNYWGEYYYYEYYNERRISYEDRNKALGYINRKEWYNLNYTPNNNWMNGSLYHRQFSSDLRQEMFDFATRANRDEYEEIYEYMQDWEQEEKINWTTRNQYNANYAAGFKNKAPRHSRWSFLVQGVSAFLDVLGGTTDGAFKGTDQKELVSLVTFASQARVDVALTDDDILNGGVAYYTNIRNAVEGIVPLGGTAIGRGLSTGLPPIVDPDWAQKNNMSGAAARPFAEKTIVVLTDGRNNDGTPDPVSTVNDMVEDNAVTIHTVTFTKGARRGPMESVASKGGGAAYHADTGEFLVQIFEEIANNLPTILTE